MNDFVKVHKMLTDENPDFSNCVEKNFFTAGEKCSIRKYTLKNHFTEIEIRMNEATGKLQVSGNLPMFWNGHNIKASYKGLHNAIEYASDKINIDLFRAVVDQFDHSAVVKTLLNPKLIIENHLNLSGHLTHPYKHGKYFLKEKVQVVKMYDAVIRMKQIYSKTMRQEILSRLGMESNLLRIEKKILHPDAYFKRIITLKELLHPAFILDCNTDLMETYNSITKAGSLQTPTNKKYLSSAILPLIVGKELEAVYGFDFMDLLKKKIASVDESILSKEDKKARQRQIRNNLNKISGKVMNQYDLSAELAASLKIDLGTAHQ